MSLIRSLSLSLNESPELIAQESARSDCSSHNFQSLNESPELIAQELGSASGSSAIGGRPQ